jgi:hypothetical protein
LKIVLEKYEDGRRTLKEISDFLRDRSVIEEQFAKGLIKIVKSVPQRESEAKGYSKIGPIKI